MFIRPLVFENGIPRPSRAGDGFAANPLASSMAVDAASTITVEKLAGGLILRSGATAARTDTTDTAVNILAAFPGMDIGDSFIFKISVQVAFAITVAGGAGVTASGNLVIAANGVKDFVLTKTGAAAMTLVGL